MPGAGPGRPSKVTSPRRLRYRSRPSRAERRRGARRTAWCFGTPLGFHKSRPPRCAFLCARRARPSFHLRQTLCRVHLLARQDRRADRRGPLFTTAPRFGACRLDSGARRGWTLENLDPVVACQLGSCLSISPYSFLYRIGRYRPRRAARRSGRPRNNTYAPENCGQRLKGFDLSFYTHPSRMLCKKATTCATEPESMAYSHIESI